MNTKLVFFSAILAALPAWADVTPTRLPDTIVQDTTPIAEAAPVGPYLQPEWTTARRFPTTRVYLQQTPWDVGVEQWVKAQYPRGEAPNYLFQEEVELGLPGRLQADIYENWICDKAGKVQHDSVSAEMRWALADWGKLPGNPTLYGEWTFRNHVLGGDKYEVKLLLGDSVTPRWHWGANFIYDQEVGAARATELGFSAALSYTVIDEKLGLGGELKIESETEQGARHLSPMEVNLGPSLQWRATRNIHIDLNPLFGLTSDSPHVETWLVLGYDFGSGASRKEIAAPVSTRSH